MCAMNIKCRIVRGTTALCSGHTLVSNIEFSYYGTWQYNQ